MHPSWQQLVGREQAKPYFRALHAFLREAYATRTVYPPETQVFSAFATDRNEERGPASMNAR